MDSRLCDCNGLLFHDFVNGHTIHVRHLVKLINTNHTTISEHHRSGFQLPLSRLLVCGDRGGKTDT